MILSASHAMLFMLLKMKKEQLINLLLFNLIEFLSKKKKKKKIELKLLMANRYCCCRLRPTLIWKYIRQWRCCRLPANEELCESINLMFAHWNDRDSNEQCLVVRACKCHIDFKLRLNKKNHGKNRMRMNSSTIPFFSSLNK